MSRPCRSWRTIRRRASRKRSLWAGGARFSVGASVEGSADAAFGVGVLGTDRSGDESDRIHIVPPIATTTVTAAMSVPQRILTRPPDIDDPMVGIRAVEIDGLRKPLWLFYAAPPHAGQVQREKSTERPNLFVSNPLQSAGRGAADGRTLVLQRLDQQRLGLRADPAQRLDRAKGHSGPGVGEYTL